MDTYQEQNEEEYEALQENLEGINPAILNTPAEEPTNIQELLPKVSPDTFVQFNKPGQIKPDQDVVLDLGGKQTQLDSSSGALRTESKYLEKIFGEDFNVEESFNSSAVVLFFVVVTVLFFFVMFGIKRSEQIGYLEKEIEKLKSKK